MIKNLQYNKIQIQELTKQLEIREAALPTLQHKESALRIEVRKIKQELSKAEEKFQKTLLEVELYSKMWTEFDPEILEIEQVKNSTHKIAGTKVILFEKATFKVQEVGSFHRQFWHATGIEMLKVLLSLKLRIMTLKKADEALSYARKKTTQKVNLYEKVQIPAINTAIIKIKKYLEDEESLMTAAQKIVKKRKSEMSL